jgi:hypothetical protein
MDRGVLPRLIRPHDAQRLVTVSVEAVVRRVDGSGLDDGPSIGDVHIATLPERRRGSAVLARYAATQSSISSKWL